jgi:hypothetical protein
LSRRGSIKNLESVTGHHMGRMNQLSNACEGDGKLHPHTFKMGMVVLVNKILKPYYRRFVSPRFHKI